MAKVSFPTPSAGYLRCYYFRGEQLKTDSKRITLINNITSRIMSIFRRNRF